jgi:hypothetical protein
MGYIGAGPTRFNTADELTVTGNAEFNGNLTVKGTTTTIDSVTVQNFDMGDNDRIRIGDSQDLQIYHDGSTSIIAEASTGSLKIQGSDLYLTDDDGTNMLYAANNGGVTLYNGGGAKLATTATGVDVTGTVTADGLTSTGAGANTTYFVGGSDTVAGRQLTLSCEAEGGQDNATHRLTVPSGYGHFAVNVGASERLRIDSSGNVGIGTSSPARRLTLHNSSATTSHIQMTNAATGEAGTNGVLFGVNGSGEVELWNYESTAMRFAIGGSEKMTIDSSGNVGIGTSVTGDAELVVYGADAATIYKNTNTGTGTSDGFFVGLAKGNGTDAYVYQRENTNMIFGTNNAERMRIDSSGNVGIGTTSMVRTFEITDGTSGKIRAKGTNGGFIECHNGTNGVYFGTAPAVLGSGSGGDSVIFTDSGFNQLYYTSGVERMRIDSSGRVTMPYQPAWGARSLSNATSSGGTSNANEILKFSSIIVNTGNHYNSSTGVFTCPVAGRYFVTFSGLYDDSYNNTGAVYIRHNGSEKYRGYHQNSGSYYEQISMSGVIDAAANDTIDIYSVIAGWHIGGETSWSGFLIG